MATTTPPPPTPPHEEVENDNNQPLISSSQPPASVTTPPPPIDDAGHHQQLADSNSPPQITVSPQQGNLLDGQQYPPPEDVEDRQEHERERERGPLPSPIEDVGHNQPFASSNSPPEKSVALQPEKLGDCQLNQQPEDVVDQEEEEEEQEQERPPVPSSPSPEEKILECLRSLALPSPSMYSQPQSPPPAGDEPPPENLYPNPNQESSVLKQPMSPSTLPTEPEEHVESPNYRNSPNPNCDPDHVSPSPSSPPHQSSVQSPPATTLEGNPSPNYRNSPNPNSDHESPSPSSPARQSSFQSPSATTVGGNPSPNGRNSPNPNPKSDHESPSPSSPPHQSSYQSPSATTLGNPSPKSQQSPNDPSPSPPPTAVSPSSPQDTLEPDTDIKLLPPPSGIPLLYNVASSSPVTPQTSPWTHEETANLIQAYQEKWYSLKKGPLKAGQWEEVAITVAARCGYDEPTKSSKQCRHKIEKLRKRYRSERGKPQSKATAWHFFQLMDNLEKGPLPISSSQSMALIEYQDPGNSNGKKRKNDDNDGEFPVNTRGSRSKSSNHHVSNGGLTGNLRFSDGGSERVMRGLRTPVIHKRKAFYHDDDVEEEEAAVAAAEGSEDEEEEGMATQLAKEIKGFAERFVKMEKRKLEMMRDTERYRMEMEKKRMDMIRESQQTLVEIVNKAFRSSHKTQKLSSN